MFRHRSNDSNKPSMASSASSDVSGAVGLFRTKRDYAQIYFDSAATLLLLTSLMKLLSVIAHPRILLAPDPLLRIKLVWLMLIEAVIEIAVAAFLVSSADRRLRLLAVFWLGAVFCGYHVSLAILEPHAYCPCLGTLYGKFGVSARSADTAAKFLAAWFFLGPIALWLWTHLGPRRSGIQAMTMPPV